MNRFKDADLTKSNNLVMTMKSKFEHAENINNNNTPVSAPAAGNQQQRKSKTKPLPTLSRQLSDPVKVKRTPAFRSDQKPFQRGHATATSYREKKIVLKVSDKPSNVHLLRKQFDSKDDVPPKRKLIPLALNERSNSCAEILLNRRNNQNHDYANIAALYTEPMPKSLRAANALHNASTLKITDKSDKTEDRLETTHNCNHINDDIHFKLDALTDTLKIALKKPLPAGPAPQKPPRTFTHQSTNSPSPTNSRKEFAAKLNVNLQRNLKANTLTSGTSPKPDTKYMLEKLENAVKANKLRKSLRSASEDRREKASPTSPPPPSRSKLNLNCLNSLSCTNTTYERLSDVQVESMRSRTRARDEPVYAEPFAFLNQRRDTVTNRNSLYYMSTPIETTATCGDQDGMDSFADDEEASPSHTSAKIKDLIKTFEETTSTDRVEKLEKQLRHTLEQSFNDNDEANVGKFETYVRTIKMITHTHAKKQLKQQQMFHCCMLVTLCDKVPYIKLKYPAEANVPASIAELCFPDSHCFDCNPKAQNYSIVLTNNDGERIYGYCRRVLPEDSPHCLPLAYCILSKNRAHRFYNRILEEIESRHGIPDKQRDALLLKFYSTHFPAPGESVSLQCAHVNGSTQSQRIEIVLHQDARHKENDLEELCECLDTNVLIKVFASLLLERKVILLSCQLGRLSMCMEALQNILYPFAWPHTLIPVLPRALWEIVEAPTPLICGVLSDQVLLEHEINDAIVIDLDHRSLLLEVGDEMSILPNCLVKEFKAGLALAHSNDTKNVYNVLLSDAFLRIFVRSCGHYKEHLHGNAFDMDGFAQHPKKAIRTFLQWFMQTSMFSTFTDTLLVDKDHYKIFDSRRLIYQAHDATVILEKMKEWKAH